MTNLAVEEQHGSKPGSQGRGRGLARKETFTGFLCISPWLVGMAAFFVVPMLYSLWLSLNHYSGLGAPRFAGLAIITLRVQHVIVEGTGPSSRAPASLPIRRYRASGSIGSQHRSAAAFEIASIT